ncbi:MAG: heparinase II/III family protein [Verrucomicrobiota bacterium]
MKATVEINQRKGRFEQAPLSLFDDTCTEQQLKTIFQQFPTRSLIPKLGDQTWLKVRQKPHLQQNIARLVTTASQEAKILLPELTEDLYQSFHRTGRRFDFDVAYKTRRRLLTQSALAAVLVDDPSPFLNPLFERWRQTLAEPSWALNAHVENRSGKDPNCLDLATCETANAISELYQVFFEYLPDDLREGTKQRIHTILESYLSNSRAPWGWFRSTHNWNAICHQGILGAALNVETNPDRIVKVVSKIQRDLPRFLDGFTEDGGCTEGATYWGYGFGWFSWMNEQIESRTNGTLSLFLDNPLIEKIAHFGIDFHIPPISKINFADGFFYNRLQPGLISYLGNRLKSKRLTEAANWLYFDEIGRLGNLDAQDPDRQDFFTLARNFLHSPFLLPKNSSFPEGDCIYPNLEVWNTRGVDKASGKSWSVSAKAGNNDEHHNHNDCGSYLIHINGKPLVSEIGKPDYVKRYFHGDRYSFIAARSLGHSVPLINGCEQRSGYQYSSELIQAVVGSNPTFQADISGCYPRSAECSSAIRTITINRNPFRIQVNTKIILKEVFSLEDAIITLGKATLISESLAVLNLEGESIRITLDQNSRFDRIEDHAFRDRRGTDHNIQRIVITASQPFDSQMQFHYEFSL